MKAAPALPGKAPCETFGGGYRHRFSGGRVEPVKFRGLVIWRVNLLRNLN